MTPMGSGLSAPIAPSNRPRSTFCFLCGHGLDAARSEPIAGPPRSPISFSTPEPANPYEPLTIDGAAEPTNPYAPPATDVTTPLSFQISSLLMVIAVIALCLGVARAELVVGIIVAVVVMPALVYTVIMVKKRSTRERPMAVADKVITFIVAIGGVMIVEFSSIVAFCMTCYPIGAVSFSANSGAGVIIALCAGGLAAVATAVYATYLLVFRKGRNSRNPGKP